MPIALTLLTLVVSSFGCREVGSHQELSDVRVGLPLNFISVNFQRYTPVEYPVQFCGPGSVWEDSIRILLYPFIFNFAALFLIYLGIFKLFFTVKR